MLYEELQTPTATLVEHEVTINHDKEQAESKKVKIPGSCRDW